MEISKQEKIRSWVRIRAFGLPWTSSSAPSTFCESNHAPVASWDHARHHIVRETCPSEQRAPIVEKPDNIALGDTSRLCVGRIHPDRFAAANFSLYARGAMIKLTMKPRRRLT